MTVENQITGDAEFPLREVAIASRSHAVCPRQLKIHVAMTKV